MQSEIVPKIELIYLYLCMLFYVFVEKNHQSKQYFPLKKKLVTHMHNFDTTIFLNLFLLEIIQQKLNWYLNSNYVCIWAWCVCWSHYSYLMTSNLSQNFKRLWEKTLKVHLVIRILQCVCLSLSIPQELGWNKGKLLFSIYLLWNSIWPSIKCSEMQKYL